MRSVRSSTRSSSSAISVRRAIARSEPVAINEFVSAYGTSVTRLPESGSRIGSTASSRANSSGISVVTKESPVPVASGSNGDSPTAVATFAIRQVPSVEGSSEKPRMESADSRIRQASSTSTGRLATIETVPRTSSGTRIVRSAASPIFRTSCSMRTLF